MARAKVLWCATAMVLGMAAAGSAEDDVSIGVTADFFSKYIWRGQNVVDDWVFQPSASVGYKGLTGSVWGNMDLHGDWVDDGEFSEVDYVLDYTGTFPGQQKLGYSLGVIYYDFPNTPWDATTEVYGALTAAMALSPALRWYYDMDEADGSYIQLAVGHTIEKVTQWREDCYCDVQLGASVAYATDNYNDFYFGVGDAALNDLTLSIALPICVDKLTIKPSINYSMMIDDDIRAATGKSDNLWGGISAALSF
jgi:hypothetical protein